MQKLKELPFELSSEIEDGLGFRIGNGTRDFVFPRSDEAGSVFDDPDTGLQMQIRVHKCDDTLVISSTLKNNSDAHIFGIKRIDPLHIVFRKPSRAWRHIYALGGTTEH